MSWSKAQGVIDAGEDKVRMYMKKVTDSTATVEFNYDTDLIGELTDISGMGASRETKEYNGYHYDEVVSTIGNSTPNNVSFTENLTAPELAKIKDHYKNKDMLAVGIFSVGESAETLLLGYVVQLSSWGAEIPNGDTTSLTYEATVRTERDDFTVATSE